MGILVLLFMVLMSLAWCPKVRKLQLDLTSPARGNPSALDDSQRIRIMTGRERITAISSFAKLCLTPCIFGIYTISPDSKITLKYLSDGFLNLRNSELFSSLLTNIICGYMSRMLAKQGCKLGLQKICFALPVTLSTPLTLILVGAFDGCKLLRICQCKTRLRGEEVVETVILAALMWLSQIVSTLPYLLRSQEFIMAKDSMLFWVPSFDGKLLSSYKNKVSEILKLRICEHLSISCMLYKKP